MNTETGEDRFAALETKIAYQEMTIKELDGVVYEQGLAIKRLDAIVKLVTEKLKSLDGNAEQPMPASERPPHY